MWAAPSSSPLGSLLVPLGPFMSLEVTAGRSGSHRAAVGLSCRRVVPPSLPQAHPRRVGALPEQRWSLSASVGESCLWR